ncbi:MAG: 16S rRNA (cytosine(967)-C(5))-methyltransferase [endosymbiont of Galathealinum brachiosum]|uniref:16S rRNA (cytosine(967)-C(5))-methyltransferase n=1 Tax=endosymbiont of Galathealinum brachiosum TaxID=2200906 RepID=A0A370DD84_9GAMM|nr:MAG: 16S rRNA (cytosine(967)-C(5))-methyltransferase [endosymbiont of Galathealinum brachiosum]
MTNKQNDTSITSRKVAQTILLAVLKDGQSLSSLTHLTDNIEPRDAAFARMLSFGVLRFYQQLQGLLKPYIKKALKSKDLDIQLVMLMAIYQIMHTRVPDFAVVDSAVKQVRKSRKKWAANMVNGVLRNFLRDIEGKEPEDVINELTSEEACFAHPQWIIDSLKQDWPDSWQKILAANNQQAPMTLRVNQQQTSVDEFIQALEKDSEVSAEQVPGLPSAAILQQARDVKQLPGFSKGWFSVQDAGAQFAALIMQPAAGDKILDACAAPGGKTAHMFELQPDVQITALDISESRLKRVEENCQRLGFNPTLVAADARAVDNWWQGELFDKILLDVPCSAMGVIRRHPDIKSLRREDDIEALVQLQREILLKNWDLLKPGGQLLYVTCSLLKAENEQQIEWFLEQVDDVVSEELPDVITQFKSQSPVSHGVQLFPVDGVTDGFFYALLKKSK